MDGAVTYNVPHFFGGFSRYRGRFYRPAFLPERLAPGPSWYRLLRPSSIGKIQKGGCHRRISGRNMMAIDAPC